MEIHFFFPFLTFHSLGSKVCHDDVGNNIFVAEGRKRIIKYVKEKVDILMKYLVTSWEKSLKYIQFIAVCTNRRSRILSTEVFNKQCLLAKSNSV